MRFVLAASLMFGLFYSVLAVAEEFAEPVGQTLNVETEALLVDVLALSAELALLESTQQPMPKNHVSVLISAQPSALFRLQHIELELNAAAVSTHDYTDKELSALWKGGSHKVYEAVLRSGMHKLTVHVYGAVPNDPHFYQRLEHHFMAGLDRKIIEFQIGAGKAKFVPIRVDEWTY